MKIEWIPGTTIYGLPTGNNARYNKDVVEFEVVKMKRKYVTLKKGSFEDDYCIEGGATAAATRARYGNNSGYKFFQTKDDYLKYVEYSEKRSFVKRAFSGYIGDKKVSDRKIGLIYDILMDDSEEDAK